MDDIIKSKLDKFIEEKKIPHILFHSSRITNTIDIMDYLLNNIYENNELRKDNVLYVNCAYGKGIKFIREQLKFFAKTNVSTIQNDFFVGTKINKLISNTNDQNNNKMNFKSVILLNADFLTIDAQSALRRCIELYSHKTRFFMLITNKDNIIKPILSRFCDIYVYNENIIQPPNEILNVNKSNIRFIKKILTNIDINKMEYLEKNIFDISNMIYNQGITFNEIISAIELCEKNISTKIGLITYINKVRYEIKNEKLLIMHILNIYCLRNNVKLENIYPF